MISVPPLSLGEGRNEGDSEEHSGLLVQCHHTLSPIQPRLQGISTSLTVTADVLILHLQ